MFLLSAKFGTGQFKVLHCLLSKVANCRRNSNWPARNKELGLSYIRLNRHFIVGEILLKDILLAIGVHWVSEAGVGFVGKARVSESVSVSEVGRNSTMGVVGSEESWVSFGLSLPLADVVAGCVGIAEVSVAEVVEPGEAGETAVAAVAESESVVVEGIGIGGSLGLGLPLANEVVGG